MKHKGISRLAIVLVVVVLIVGASAAFFLSQTGVHPQTAPSPGQVGKLKVSGYNPTVEAYSLVVMTATERGIWASNDINPEFVTLPGRTTLAADIKDQVDSGIKIGLNVATEALLARANGVPIKIVAGYTGDIPTKIYVRASGPIKTVRDLDGKKVGVFIVPGSEQRRLLYISSKLGIKTESVSSGDLTNQDISLQQGRIDAFVSADPAALQMVDSGKLRVLISVSDVLPKPWANFVVWATDDIIQQNPDIVKKFVKATLEAVKYLKDNPSYATDLYAKTAGAQKGLAEKTISQLDWRVDGRGSGQDLAAAVVNVWQYGKDVDIIPASTVVKPELAVDTKFVQ
jgi:ABC-type nitrate/sulfonate/bicarbonate transport system substrate-binding protein